MQRGLSGGRFGFVQCALAALINCHLCIAFTCWIVVPSMLGVLAVPAGGTAGAAQPGSCGLVTEQVRGSIECC